MGFVLHRGTRSVRPYCETWPDRSKQALTQVNQVDSIRCHRLFCPQTEQPNMENERKRKQRRSFFYVRDAAWQIAVAANCVHCFPPLFKPSGQGAVTLRLAESEKHQAASHPESQQVAWILPLAEKDFQSYTRVTSKKKLFRQNQCKDNLFSEIWICLVNILYNWIKIIKIKVHPSAAQTLNHRYITIDGSLKNTETVKNGTLKVPYYA